MRFLIALVFVVACTIAFPTEGGKIKNIADVDGWQNSGFYMAIWNTNLLCKGKPDVNISADTQCHSFYSQNTYWWTRVSCWNTTMYQQNYFSDTACMNPTTNWGLAPAGQCQSNNAFSWYIYCGGFCN